MREHNTLREILMGECPVHGVEEFRHSHRGNLWACLGAHKQIVAGVPSADRTYCSSLILGEDYTPDGYDIVQGRTLKWHNVIFNRTERFLGAWDEYLSWCATARGSMPNV